MNGIDRSTEVQAAEPRVLPLSREQRESRVSVVIPVFNSEATIGPLCLRLISELEPTWRLQIVLVDDGSQDGSAAICRKLHYEHPGIITCVMLSKNFGEHNAVMAGLNYAEGDYCIVMDDDFQNPPEEVARLLNELNKGFDVVYVRYAQKKHSPWRNLGSRLHNLMATYALRKPKDLYLSSFKAMSRFLVDEVVQYKGPDPYLDAILLRITRNIGVLDVAHEPRKNGASGYTFGKLFGLWGNMIIAFSIYPLRVIGLYGVVTALAGAVYAGYRLVQFWSPMPDPSAYEQLNASMWFFRGSILLALSIVGEYVGRIYMNLNKSPQYVVRSRLPCRRDALAAEKTAHPKELP